MPRTGAVLPLLVLLATPLIAEPPPKSWQIRCRPADTPGAEHCDLMAAAVGQGVVSFTVDPSQTVLAFTAGSTALDWVEQIAATP